MFQKFSTLQNKKSSPVKLKMSSSSWILVVKKKKPPKGKIGKFFMIKKGGRIGKLRPVGYGGESESKDKLERKKR